MADQLTHKRIQRVWEAMDGGPEGWLKTFGYQQFALAIIAEFLPQADEAAIGRAHPLAGSEGGFTMCAWKAADVPVGTPLYLRPASPPVAVQEERDAKSVTERLTQWFREHEFDNVDEINGAWKAIEALGGPRRHEGRSAMTPAKFRAVYGLTYQWDAGLAEPVHCTFTDTEEGPCLEAAFVGGVDIYNEGKGSLIDSDMVKRIESAAYTPLMRQAEQTNAERRYERRAA